MNWKKTVIVIAIVFGGALGRAAALGTTGVEEQTCWSEYPTEVVQIFRDFESCVDNLSLFGSLGSEICGLIYVGQAEAALALYIGCSFSLGFGLIG